MTTFSVRLVHRGGAIDEHHLGEFANTSDAVRKAQTYLFVSPSALVADVLADGALAKRISRTGGRVGSGSPR